MGDEQEIQVWTQRIGRRLRATRKGQGLSLEDLSRLSGSTVPTLSHIERGTRDVKLSTLVSLASALRVDLANLFAAETDTSKPQQPDAKTVGYDLDDD